MKINTWEQEKAAIPKRRWAFVFKPGPKLKSHCKHGHPYNKTNTIIQRSGTRSGRRLCRACAHIRREQFSLIHPDKERHYDRNKEMLIGEQWQLDSRKPDPIWYDICSQSPSNPLEELMRKEEAEEKEKYKHIGRRVEWAEQIDVQEAKISKLIATAPNGNRKGRLRAPITKRSPERGITQRHIKMSPVHFV